MIRTINPSNGQLIKEYTPIADKKVQASIDAGHIAFEAWRKTSFEQRKALMLSLANLLKENITKFAKLVTKEMGKPIEASKAEIEKCSWVCEHYANHAQSYLQTRDIKTDFKSSKVFYQPLGIIFAIMPWNFPFWQVFRFAAPTLMAGNAAILKHASISTGTGCAIAELIQEAGFPEHLFQHFIIDNDGAADVIKNNKIAAVTLTGSDRAGKVVASLAGAHLKKAVLELGGSDPYIVLKDADIELASREIIASRMNNGGQSCIAAKRIIVEKAITEELINHLKTQLENYRMGDPMEPTTLLGPMAREDLRDELHKQVNDSVEKGAVLKLGGIVPNREGFFYPATLLTGVKPGMPAFDEELFGPVVSVITAEDETEAVRLANQSSFGLGAAIFSRDIKKAERIAINDIQSGSCFVNSFVASDPRLPFGGIKQSGYGRELSKEGILEFVNIKTIAVK